ncbi:MAG: methionyl-tRNA formyltransferase [Thermomicrobiales bacterium]|nr:methionyl-tRNA formyltransferase [Thermomicrobiales bacterium]
MSDPSIRKDGTKEPVRVVFFGTPDYAVPALKLLATDDRFDVRLVVTQPDRPAGRRHQMTEPAVKIAARELGMHVYQPESLRSPEARAPLEHAGADVFVVAAYGLILGPKTLAMPAVSCVNLHASLLPLYRGASPIACAILAGERETGVTLMQMDRGLDTGPVYAATSTVVEECDTTDVLTARLSEIGAELLLEHLPSIAAGRLQPTPQDDARATMTRRILKSDGAIDWSHPADAIERQIRAMWPWPRAWAETGNAQIQIHKARVHAAEIDEEPGTVLLRDSDVIVACGGSTGLILELMQPAGSKPVTAQAWMAGLRGALPRFVTPEVARTRPPLIQPAS